MPNIRIAFAAAVDARCDYQCPAVQDAIDAVAKEFRDGRAGLLAALRRSTTTDADFCDWVLCMWGRAPLKLATGRSRDEWLTLIG